MKFWFFFTTLIGFSQFTDAQTLIASYDFEDSTQYADWHFVNDANGWYIGAAEDVNHTIDGSHGLYISNDSGASNAYSNTVSDSWAYIDIVIPTGYLEFSLEFDWKCKGEGDAGSDVDWDYMKIYMGISSIPSGNTQPFGTEALVNDLRTLHQTCFNGFNGFDYSLYPSWNHFTHTFPGARYGGQTIRLYLYWHNDGSTAKQPPMAIDNIVLTGFTCGRIHNIVAVPTPSKLFISFFRATPTDSLWEYICVPVDSPITGITPILISDTFFTVTNLQADMEYDVYVRTNCGLEKSDWETKTFRTTCFPIDIIPYYNNFDTLTTAFPDCWFKINTGSVISPSISSASYEGDGSLYFCTSPVDTSYNIAVMEGIDESISINTLMATFMYKNNDIQDYLLIGVMDNPLDENTFYTIDTVRYDRAARWYEFDVLFNNYTGSGHYIAFKIEGAGQINTAYIDNLSVNHIPTCIRPAGVTVSNITETGVTVSWGAQGDETSWEISVVPNGNNPDSTTFETVYTNFVDISGLIGDTPYQVYVRTNCGNDHSLWTYPVAFRTACSEYITLPYFENFDTYGTDSYPACWHRLSTSVPYPRIESMYSSSGSGSLRFCTSTTTFAIAIAPAVNTYTNPINSLSVSFKMFKTSASSGACEIGVITDLTNDSTFTTIATILPSDLSINTWKEFDFNLSSYSGTGNYLALRSQENSNNTFYMDDISIYETSPCAKPLNVEISRITPNSVVVDWEPRNNESTWFVVVVPTGHDVSTTTPHNVHRHPYTVMGLTGSTTYDVYVQAVCDDGSTSTWSSVSTFTTLCSPQMVILPYSENFDDCFTDANAALPDCWMKFTNSTTAYPYPSNAEASSGTISIYFNSTTTNYSYLVSPALDLSQYATSTLYLTYKTLKTSSISGRLNVGYMTDPADINTFILLQTLYPYDYVANNTWYLRDVVISRSFSEPVYIAFVAPQGRTNSVYLDDINLDYVPDCLALSELQISNIAGSSALISWTKSPYGALDYTVEYKVADQDNWIIVSDITENHVLLSGLMPNTSYDVKVSAHCNNTSSDYITGSFTTGYLSNDSTATCIKPNVFIINVNDHSVTLEWAPGNDESLWEIEYKSASDTMWTQVGAVVSSPYVLDGLIPDEDYIIKIRSDCFPDYSDWVTLNFATECVPIDTLPFTENFDSAPGSGAGNFISCWTKGTNGTIDYPYTYNVQSVSPPFSLYVHGGITSYSYAATPRFNDTIRMDSLLVTFQMRKILAAYFIEIGIMTNPNDYNTFMPIGTATPSGLNTWELAEINTNNYQGDGHYLAFRAPKWMTNNIYIDDITIQYIPDCHHINDLIVNDITTNSASITWSAGGDENTWEYLFGESGTIDLINDIPTQIMDNFIQRTDLIEGTDYEISVRSICQNGEYSTWTSTNFRTICETPSNLSSSVTTTTATLLWIGTGNFEVSYKETSETNWSSDIATNNSTITITNLPPNTNYDWRVRKKCKETIYSDWEIGTFQTAGEPVCPTPTNLTVSDITDNSATLSWEQEENTAIEWTLNYKPANVNDWTISTITDNPYTITDLIANTDYEAKIRANCLNGINSDYTDSIIFTTPVDIKDYTLSNCIRLYPNPTSTYIDVKFSLNTRVNELKVYDVYDRLLQTIQVNENPTRINVSDLAAGIYFVRAVTKNGIANKSFIKK